MKKLLFAALIITGATTALTSCTAVKPYQKSKLNDTEMQLSARKVQQFEMNFLVYREGASGGNGGKTSGGCGCN